MGGSGGRFLASVIHALADNIELQDRDNGHYPWTFQYYSKNPPARDPVPEWFAAYCADLVHPKLGRRISHNIICNHWPHTKILLQGLPRCRVIEVTYGLDDVDQISYNFLVKNQSNQRRSQQIEKIKDYARDVFFNSIPASTRNYLENDIELLTALYARSITSLLHDGHFQAQVGQPRMLQVPFRDIYQGRLGQHLPCLADFVGFELDAAKIDRAREWSENYARCQPVIPWSTQCIIPINVVF